MFLRRISLCGLFVTTSLIAEVKLAKVQSVEVNSGAFVQVGGSCTLKKDEPIYLHVANFPIGMGEISPQYPAMRKLPFGSTVLVYVNGDHRFYVEKNDVNPFDEQRSYFNKRYRKKVPSPIAKKFSEDKPVVITAILVNPNGESVKLPKACHHRIFSYQHPKEPDEKLTAAIYKSPYVIYNEPYGTYIEGKAILIDYIPQNVEISPWSYKVKVYLDGKPIATLMDLGPYALYHVPAGKHTLKLILIDAKNNAISNPVFPAKEQTFYVISG